MEKHPDGPLLTRHKIMPGVRWVMVENGGIRVDKHWFMWDYFFDVNEIVQGENK